MAASEQQELRFNDSATVRNPIERGASRQSRRNDYTGGMRRYRSQIVAVHLPAKADVFRPLTTMIQTPLRVLALD